VVRHPTTNKDTTIRAFLFIESSLYTIFIFSGSTAVPTGTSRRAGFQTLVNKSRTRTALFATNFVNADFVPRPETTEWVSGADAALNHLVRTTGSTVLSTAVSRARAATVGQCGTPFVPRIAAAVGQGVTNAILNDLVLASKVLVSRAATSGTTAAVRRAGVAVFAQLRLAYSVVASDEPFAVVAPQKGHLLGAVVVPGLLTAFRVLSAHAGFGGLVLAAGRGICGTAGAVA